MMLSRCALRGALGAVASLSIASAEPLAMPPEAATETESIFDGPVDFSLPSPANSANKIDASKFIGTGAAPTWDGKVGVDRSAPASLVEALRPDRVLPDGAQDLSSGVAWAKVTPPAPDWPWSWDKATLETRVDPQQQGTLGMTLSRSLSLGGDASMTWLNSYGLSQSLGHGGAPVPGGGQVYSTNQAMRFTIGPAATTFSLGATLSSAGDKWLRTLSAEQKLFGGPLSVVGAMSESATGDISRSLKAGFKRNW